MFSLVNKASLIKLITILIIVGFLTYASSLTNLFVWDDIHFFYQNLFTQNLTHIKEIFTSNTTAGAGVSSNYYRPLTTLTFAVDHYFWGWNPIGLHLTNTIFHIINCVLLFLLLLLLRFNKLGSFLVSLIFLIHPIQTEAVTYLSSRGDILYAFFLLASLYLFTLTLYKQKIVFIINKKHLTLSQNFLLTTSLLLFPLSVLSKEGALTTIPIYAGILFIFALQKKLSFKKLHKEYRSHFIIILLIIWIAILYFLLRLSYLSFNNSLNYSGDQSIYAKNLLIRIYTFLKTLIIYIRLLLVPYPLYLERSTSLAVSVFNPWVVASLGTIAFAVYAGVVELRKKHTGWIFLALILIFSNLAAVSGIIPMTGLLRENWLYMPMIGFYMIVFVFLQTVYPSLRANAKQSHKIVQILFVLYCLILIGMTIQQNYNWRNRMAYFEHNLRFVNSARLHLNLGNAYIAEKNYDKALFHLREAVKIEDSYPQTHYNIANIYIQQKKYKEAEKELLISLSIDPSYIYSYPVLIDLYEQTKQFDKTLPYLKRLNLIYPNDLKLTIMYADDLWKSGKTKEAEEQFAKAIKLSKNDPKLIQAIAETKKSIDK
jgi:Tfp pilus assembly protein PilF